MKERKSRGSDFTSPPTGHSHGLSQSICTIIPYTWYHGGNRLKRKEEIKTPPPQAE